MNVKRYTLTVGVVFFVCFLMAQGLQNVRAQEAAPPPPALGECPEYQNSKNRPADIGGTAWNVFTSYISNQFSESSVAGVKKFGVKKEANSNEIYGLSYSTRYERICWGKECARDEAVNRRYCSGGEQGCLRPNRDSYTDADKADLLDNRSDSFAELDFDNREKICQEFDVDSMTPRRSCNADNTICTSVYKPCDLVPVNKRGVIQVPGSTTPVTVTPAYCLYPLKGWFKIKALKEDGWTRLNMRINGTAVPEPRRNDDYTIKDPGTFGLFENWNKLNCADDAVFRLNKKACTRGVVYNPQKKEFYGWAWNPLLKWISFSGSTLYDTRGWRNPFWCAGASCLTVSYNEQSKRSRWSTAYLGVWVKGIGGNFFARKGFDGVNPPPGEFNADYLIITGKYTEGTEVKSGKIGPWEARCDDTSTRAECVKVARKAFDTGVPIQTQREGVVDAALPVASARTNRSLMKRSTLGLFNAVALLPKSDALPGTTGTNESGNIVKVMRNESDVFGPSRAFPVSLGGTTSTGSPNNAVFLSNTIYYYEGDLIIGGDDDRSKRIISSALSSGQGGGTIVVRGNIVIKRPIEYDRVTLINNDIRQLASLSWVALKKKNESVTSPISEISNTDWKEGGNIVIDSCIPSNESDEALNGAYSPLSEKIYDRRFTEVVVGGEKRPLFKNSTEAAVVDGFIQHQQFATVVGSFFAENTFATGHGHGGGGVGECTHLKVKYKTSKEGTVTNEDGSTSIGLVDETDATAGTLYYDVPLEIRGVIVARDILFQRIYRGINRGSETIVNTGRTLVNPPPGIAEFVRSLPLW